MFKNYLKIAFRNLTKHKQYSIINILGLTIGITAFLLILLFVQYELSYDKHNKNAMNIYRASVRGVLGDNEFTMAVSCACLGKTLKEDFPEVLNSTRINSFGVPVLRYGEKVFSEEKWYNTDQSFFDVFTVNFITGDPTTALIEANSVVMTETSAKKYFGDENPVGQTVTADNRVNWMVTGVIEDFPENSYIKPDFLGSLVGDRQAQQTNWLNNSYHTFILLPDGFDYEELESKFTDFVTKYVGPQVQQAMGVSWEKMGEGGAAYEYYLQPLTQIHLNSHIQNELEANSDIKYVYIFSVVALFILVIACINFMNLATARSAGRAKEVGIRKTLGSNKRQLIYQFLSESFVLTLVAVVLSMIFVVLLLPYFNNIVNMQLVANYFNLRFILLLSLLVVIVGLVAGSYPAFYLSSFSPVKVLKSDQKITGKHSWLRSGLVIFQFIISIFLFSGTIVVINQLNYMQNKNLGYDKENLIIIKKTDDLGNQTVTRPFIKELEDYPGIIKASSSTGYPGRNSNSNVYSNGETSAEDTRLLHTFWTDCNYQDAWKFKMAEGRFYSADRATDSSGAVINEAAVASFGIKDPVGKYIIRVGSRAGQSDRLKIVGVVKNLHFESLQQKIRPMVIRLMQGPGWTARYMAVRVAENDIQGSIDHMEKTWKKYSSDQAFEYVFFDDDFKRLYETEVRTKQIVSIFSILAIFVACLGLYGLASFTIEQRTKEIGIRKVLGASVPSIFKILSIDILKLVLISTVISFPISYYLMTNWLQNFDYRISYSILTFIFSGLLSFTIAILTISNQAIRAATANPVETLKYE